MPTRVEINYHLLKRLAQVGPAALRDLGPVAAQQAKTVFGASKQFVPIGEEAEEDSDKHPPLFTTGFVDGPEVNAERLSVSATCGYAHPSAGPIHEGVHWGVQLKKPPPHFLRKPARKGRAAFKKAVAAQLLATLSRLFPRNKSTT